MDETTGALKEEGFFPSNQLLVQKLTDEDRNEKYVFADAEGRQLLVRRVDGNTYSDVYFVHDLRGNIRYVLQPMYQKQPSIDKFAFRYLYDETNRCIEKQLPGCEKIVYAYDAADRMVMSQTGNQRRTGHKTFYRYDALGRNTHVVERAVGNDSLVTIRKFYDDYSFLDQQGFNSPCFKVSAQRAQGLLTGREVAVYGCDSLLREVNLYDRKGRLTRQIRTNMRGGYDDTSYKYSFTDKPVSKLMVHSTANMPTLTQRYEYEYDHADRLAKVTYSLNNAEKKTLREIDYDELGRVHDERTGDMAELARTINYNIRSWPIVRYCPLLEEKICYEDGYPARVEYITPCYSGNISAYVSSIGKPAKGRFEETNNIKRCFRFNYDGLSRLKKAEYVENDKANNHYDTSYKYDLQGNLITLWRNGEYYYDMFGPIDYVEMKYNGNQLCKASDRFGDPRFSNGFQFTDGSDRAEEYTYDANGNMTADLNKHICKISYNTQNLPQDVRFTDGSSIAYLYDADGNKLRTSYAIASYSESMPVTQVMHGNVSSQAQQPYMARNSIDYCGSAVYENGKLAYVPIDGGYITFADSTATSAPTFHYYVKDYLGNNRLVVRDDGFGEQMNHYYPFGALMSASTQGAAQRYKYNGKELDRIHGLNLYDYGARQYDAALGRWTSIDPLAEKYYDISPYAYCANNPVVFVDPDGCKFDFSKMTKDEYQSYLGQINLLRGASPLFNTMYTSLELSKNTYFISFDEVRSVAKDKNEIFGHFVMGDNGGALIFNKEHFATIPHNVFAEEFFHAYQYDNRDGYAKGEFNKEFEAKTFAFALTYGMGTSFLTYKGMSEFQKRIMKLMYGTEDNPISREAVMSNAFLDDYMVSAEKYAKYNIVNRIGGINYRLHTKVKPYALQKIVLDTYK